MQCSKCGTVLEEGAIFCPQCGAVCDMTLAQPGPVVEEPAEVMEAPVAEEPVMEKTDAEVSEELPAEAPQKLPVAVWFLGVALLLAMVIIIVLAGRPKPCTSALDTYIGVFYEGDMSRIRQLAPPEYWQYWEKEGTPWGQEELRLQMMCLSSRYIQVLACGVDVQVSCAVESQEQIESDCMTELKKWAEEEYGISPEKITEGYFLKYKLFFSGSKGELTEDSEHYVLLIDKQWYLVESYTAQWETYYEFPVFTPGPGGVFYGSVME